MKRAPKKAPAVSHAQDFPLLPSALAGVQPAIPPHVLAAAAERRTVTLDLDKPLVWGTTVAADVTPLDLALMKADAFEVVIAEITAYEKHGKCDPRVRESLLAIKLLLDRYIRNLEKDGIPRRLTDGFPVRTT